MQTAPFTTEDELDDGNPSPRLTAALLTMILAVVVLALAVPSRWDDTESNPPSAIDASF